MEARKPVLIKKSVVWRIVGGEAVILGADGNSYFGLNKVGTRMWLLLGKGRTDGEIVEALSGEYGLSRPRVEKDYNDFIKLLKKEKLIEDGGDNRRAKRKN